MVVGGVVEEFEDLVQFVADFVAVIGQDAHLRRSHLIAHNAMRIATLIAVPQTVMMAKRAGLMGHTSPARSHRHRL